MRGKLYQAVLENAQKRKEELFDEKKRVLVFAYEKEKQNLLDKFNKDFKALEDEFKFKLESKKAKIDSKVNTEILNYKKDKFNKICLEAASKMEKLDDKKLLNYFTLLIKLDELNKDEEVLSSIKSFETVVKMFNEKHKTHFKFKYQKDLEPGFILVNKNFDIDARFISVFKETLEKKKAEIAKILFGDNDA